MWNQSDIFSIPPWFSFCKISFLIAPLNYFTDIPPEVDTSYRSNYTKFWMETLPNKMSKYVVDPLFEYTPPPSSQRPKITHRNTGNAGGKGTGKGINVLLC